MPEWYTPCPAIACSDVVIQPKLHVATVVSYMQGFLRTRTVLRVDERLTHIFDFTIKRRDKSPHIGFHPLSEPRNTQLCCFFWWDFHPLVTYYLFLRYISHC